MSIEGNQEFQRKIKNYSITFLSGEIILIPYIIQEDINEDRDDYIEIDLRIPAYNHRLYEAFKNKELVQSIIKHSTNQNLETREEISRTFSYDKYFKIHSFVSCHDLESCSNYEITFQSI